MALIQRIKARPLEYARKIIDPLWWVKRISASIKRSPRRRMEAEECQRILEMLNKMTEGNFLDTASYRNCKLSQILQYAGEHCTYYKNVFQQVGFNTRSLEGFASYRL